MLTSIITSYKYINVYTSQLYCVTNWIFLLYDSDSLKCRFIESVTFKSHKKYTGNIVLPCTIVFFRAATYSIKHTVSTKDKHSLSPPKKILLIYITSASFSPSSLSLLPIWGFLCPEGKGIEGNNFNVNHGLSRALKKNNGEVINCEILTFLTPTRLIIFLPLSEAGIGEKLKY